MFSYLRDLLLTGANIIVWHSVDAKQNLVCDSRQIHRHMLCCIFLPDRKRKVKPLTTGQLLIIASKVIR